MAKYSRSALTMRESLTEISSQKAEQFLNTFYFQYGHRSIADLAHIPFAVERLSLLAAITLVDETRWDGQERSTRYQDFRRSGWYTPELSKSGHKQFTAAIQALFHAYDEIGAGMFEALKKAIPQPEEMKPESYARTLKARAFDAARYHVAAGDEYVAGADCECAHAGDAGVAAAVDGVCGDSRAGDEAARGGEQSGVECAARPAGGDGRRGMCRSSGDRGDSAGADAAGEGCADAGEVCGAERVCDGEPQGAGAGGA